MRKGINKVTLVGNVGDEPKVNTISEDLKVARFPLATNEYYLDKDGNEVQKTDWHTVVAWNRELRMASSVASATARNRDDMRSFLRTGAPVLSPPGRMRSSFAVENAMT